jgi:hypothetical protein
MKIYMGGLHEAKFYESIGGGRVLCTLCPHDCRIADGGRGACGVRYNHAGKLYTLVYDKVVARNVEPVEKKLYSSEFLLHIQKTKGPRPQERRRSPCGMDPLPRNGTQVWGG